MNKQPLFIIDAYNIIYRSYFAIPNMLNPHMENISAVFGFINFMFNLQKTYNTNNWIIVFDTLGGSSHKKDMYSQYKSNREKQPEDLTIQIKYIQEFCKYVGWTTIQIPNIEADDILFSLAIQRQELGPVHIVSSDKDLYQALQYHNVTIISPSNITDILTADSIKQKLDVTPNQIVDYLSLIGDTSDNILGIPKIGPKTAAKLLNEFGSIKNMKIALPITHKFYREITQTFADLLHLNATIIRLTNISNVNSYLTQNPLNANKLLLFLQHHKLQKFTQTLIKQHLLSEHQPTSPTNISSNQGGDILEILSTATTHTIGILPITAEYSHALKMKEPQLVLYTTYNHTMCYLNQETLLYYAQNIADLLQSDSNIVCYDLKMIEIILMFSGASILYCGKNVFDVKIGTHLLNSESDLTLTSIIQHFTSVYMPNTNILACTDPHAAATLLPYISKTHTIMKEQIDSAQLLEAYHVERNLTLTIAKMERFGIPIDRDILRTQHRLIHVELTALKQKIFARAGIEFNINSPAQVKHFLCETKKLVTSAQFKQLSYIYKTIPEPLIHDIIEYRSLYKMLTTISNLQKHIDNGRIHATFDTLGTATGRISCKSPNLQNIPLKNEIGTKIRKAFTTKNSEWYIISADYSQIEIRILAYISKDSKLMLMFDKGEDAHTQTAALIFNIPVADVSITQRNIAKMINFGIIYGQTSFGLAQSVGISPKTAHEFIQMYFKNHPQIDTAIKEIIATGKETLYVYTHLGTRRPVSQINSHNSIVRRQQERVAVNSVIQGTAAMFFKKVLLKLDELLTFKYSKSAHLALNIHDEVLIIAHHNVINSLIDEIKATMEAEIQGISIPVNIRIEQSWDLV